VIISATGKEGACAKCGAPATESVYFGVVDREALTVATDIACRECGYNQRTLRIAGRCPECGAAVIDCVRPANLRYADREWLERLHSGLKRLVRSLAAALSLPFAFACVASLLPYGLGEAFGLALATACIVGIPLLWTCAVVAITAPRALRKRETQSVRTWARWLTIGGSVLFPASLLGVIASHDSIPRLAAIGLAGACALCLLVGAALALQCLRPLAVGERKRGLARITRYTGIVLFLLAGDIGVLTVLVLCGWSIERLVGRLDNVAGAVSLYLFMGLGFVSFSALLFVVDGYRDLVNRAIELQDQKTSANATNAINAPTTPPTNK
jgi:DNA-directed RNA polymerase subunit RPC12/RpoP